MTQPSAPVTIETLLSQSDWVRRLAYSLTRDAAEADDLVQETWLAVAQHPPAHDSNLKSWLRAVMKSIRSKRWRGETRRAAREHAVAASELADDVAELSARASMLSKVAGHVHELDEAQRTVVLLRYFDDLPPRVIAERLGVPVNTVNSRLQRAHARLRDLLRDEFGDGWAAALLPLLRWPPTPVAGPAGPRATRFRRIVRASAAPTALLVVGLAVVLAARASRDASRPPPGSRDAVEGSVASSPSTTTGRRHADEPDARGAVDSASASSDATDSAATAAMQAPNPNTIRATGTVTVSGASATRVSLRLTPLAAVYRNLGSTIRTLEVAAGPVDITLPRTDEMGRRIAEWVVDADAADHIPTQVRLRVPLPSEGGDAAIPEIKLTAAAVATGIVTWDASPGATARVGSFDADYLTSMKPFDLVQVTPGAEFRVRLPPGKSALVVAVVEDCIPMCRTVETTAPGAVVSVGDYALVRGNWIRGRLAAEFVGIGKNPVVHIRPERLPAKCLDFDGFWVSWDGTTARRYSADLHPAADGTFAAGGFGRERFHLALDGAGAVAGDIIDPIVERVIEAPTDTADMILSGTPVEIAVTSGGRPLSDARVGCEPAKGRPAAGVTGADGMLTCLGKPGSTYTLSVERDGYEPATGSVSVPASGAAPRTAVDLVAKPSVLSATWIVRVRSADGTVPPIVGFGFFAGTGKASGYTPIPNFVRDVPPTDGEFRIENIQPGGWRLEIRPGSEWYDASNFEYAPELSRQLGAGEVAHDEVTAAPAGRAVLEVSGLEGVAPVSWRFRIRDETHGLVPVTVSHRSPVGLTVAPAVPFEGIGDLYPALPPGRYLIEADDVAIRHLVGFSVPFEIVAGRVTHVPIKVTRR